MFIDKKSVEILLRSSIERDKAIYEQEMNFLIKKAEDGNKKKELLDLKDIHNKMLYYFDVSNKNYSSKSILQRARSELKKIDESDLYSIFYPEEIKETKLIYPLQMQQKIKGIIKDRNNKDKILENNLPYANKILLYGEPWTGKTQIAMNLAKQLNIPLVLVRLDEVISSYLGKTWKNLKDIFSLIGKHECVLFFDELDAIGKNRNDNQELWELKRVVTVFLQNLDITDTKGLIIGATNHPDMIDLALWRRFDTILSIKSPTSSERKKIFTEALLPKALETLEESKIDFQGILPELTGSYIKKIADCINRMCIIEDDYSVILILKAFFESIPNEKRKTNTTHKAIAKQLHKNNLDVKDISKILSTPYTTIRGRVL